MFTNLYLQLGHFYRIISSFEGFRRHCQKSLLYIYPKRYCISYNCRRFETERPKSYQNCILTPKRYNKHPYHHTWIERLLFTVCAISKCFTCKRRLVIPCVNTTNWRASCNKLVSDFLGQIFVLVQMSSIFACDLGLNGKTLPRNFFCCFVFRFQEIFLNQHWQQMRASLILLFGKTKAFFGKDTARKNTAFLHTLFVEKERETSKLK